jgi:hypothetical protein
MRTTLNLDTASIRQAGREDGAAPPPATSALMLVDTGDMAC